MHLEVKHPLSPPFPIVAKRKWNRDRFLAEVHPHFFHYYVRFRTAFSIMSPTSLQLRDPFVDETAVMEFLWVGEAVEETAEAVPELVQS